jgi:hypothetical protein
MANKPSPPTRGFEKETIIFFIKKKNRTADQGAAEVPDFIEKCLKDKLHTDTQRETHTGTYFGKNTITTKMISTNGKLQRLMVAVMF